MFCPTCKKSFPDAAESCPECQGELTSVIQISIDDPPDPDKANDELRTPVPPEPVEITEPIAPVEVAPPAPAERPPATEQDVLVLESTVRPATPNLWMASTILCAVLLFVVIFFDSSDSKNKAQPEPTSTVAGPQLQATEEKPEREEPQAAFEAPLETPVDQKARARELLSSAQESRIQGDWQGAERYAEEANSLYRRFGGTNVELASSLEELARIHIGMNRPVKAEAELKQAQRLNYSKTRQALLASLLPQPVAAKNPAPVKRRKPSLGEPSAVPKAAPRVPEAKPRVQARKPRPRMKEIEAYSKSDEEEAAGDLPLGQQDVVEGYRSSRRTGNSQIPGLR